MAALTPCAGHRVGSSAEEGQKDTRVWGAPVACFAHPVGWYRLMEEKSWSGDLGGHTPMRILRPERCGDLPEITLRSQDQDPRLPHALVSKWGHLLLSVTRGRLSPREPPRRMGNCPCPQLISLGKGLGDECSSLGEKTF